MNDNVKVSIIVPVYNVEKYVVQCIESLQQQTYSNIEIVLVDDGSTDRCPEICDAYSKEDERIVVIHKQNGGLVNAWIDGTRASTGEYLCFVDSDDWVEKDMIAEFVAVSNPDCEEIICSDLWLEFESRCEERKNQLKSGEYSEDVLTDIWEKGILGNEQRLIMFSRCTKLISRRLIENNIQFCEKSIRMGEDLNIILPALLDCKRLVVLDKKFYHYRQNEDSIIHVYDPNMYRDIRNLYKAMKHILEQKQIRNAHELASKEYIMLLFLVVKNELKGNTECVRHIKEICKDADNRKILTTYALTLTDKANMCIYFVMKHPGTVLIWMLRMLMCVKERMGK